MPVIFCVFFIVSQEYDLVVLLDADTYFMDWNVPLTTLMHHWGFDKQTLFMSAVDPGPPEPGNINSLLDVNGTRVVMLNIGFSVWRNAPKMLNLMDQWASCTTNITGCDIYFSGMWRDQTAFNVFIRPQLTDKELLILPCDDANGGNFTDNGNCTGRHVSHFWLAKEQVQAKMAAEFEADSKRLQLAEMLRTRRLQRLLPNQQLQPIASLVPCATATDQ